MRISHFICCIILIPLALVGQNPEIDEYKQLIQSEENDTMRLQAMIRMSYAFIYVNPDSTFMWADRSDSLAMEIGMTDFLVHTNSVRGSAHWATGDHDAALEYFYKALDAYEAQEDVLGMADCYGNIAIIYDIQGLNEKAIEFGRKDVGVRVEMSDLYGQANGYLNLGTFFLNSDQVDSSRKYLNLSMKVSEEIGNEILLANASMNLGSALISEGNFSEAIPYLEDAIVVFESAGNLYDMAESYSDLAYCQYQIAEFEDGLKSSLEAIEVGNTLGANHILMRSYEFKYKLDRALKNYDEAFDAFENYMAYKDSVFNAESAEKIADLRSGFELELKEQENLVLKKESEAQKEAIQQGNWIMLFGGLTIVLFVILLLSQARYNRIIKKKNLQLESEHRITAIQKRELEELNQKLEELNHIKDQLFSMISHDFRSPLVALYNTLQLLELEELGPESIQQYSASLSAQTENTLEMLDNILHWANLQMKGTDVEKSEIALNHEVGKILELFEPQIKRKDISVNRSFSPEIKAYMDPNALNLALRNLVSNAIKYTERGGEISVSTHESDKAVVIEVRDSGIGLSEDEIKKLFQFGKKVKLGTENEKGTGLGLALTHLFLGKNDARIEASSKNGTTMRIIIPNEK